MSDLEEEGRSVPDRKVSYRLTNEEYDTMLRIADLLFKNGKIKVNSVNALAKACCFAQINIYLNIEAKENAMAIREKQLESEKIALARQGIIKYDNVPNLGTY